MARKGAAIQRTRSVRPVRSAEAAGGTDTEPAVPAAVSAVAAVAAVAAGVPELDPLIHERLRLGIVSVLAVNETLSFNDLKQLLRASDGNLSVHARKLEEAGYVACSKYFEGRLPKTDYRLTTGGRQALERYLAYMEELIRATRGE